MKKWLCKLSILVAPYAVFGQSDSIWKLPARFTIEGFADVFYAYDFNKPSQQQKLPFLYNHNRHNEFNLNLGYLKFSARHQKYRANLALQAGTYANDNYASEPGLLKNIFEANVGIALTNSNKFWLDAGIASSHIGFESAISIDNWTLTRSIAAENSPYYLSGARLSFSPNSKWEMMALVCNGWQHIQKIAGNSLPSFGTQVKYTSSDKTILNWSTFIGTDDPDYLRRMRYFSNLYTQFQSFKKWGFIAGLDIGLQQQAKNDVHYDLWFSPQLIGRYTITNKWATAFRIEYYQDKQQVMIPTSISNGFSTTGYSINVDYTPVSDLQCRIACRYLNSQDKVFQTPTSFSYNNFCITASMSIRFGKEWK